MPDMLFLSPDESEIMPSINKDEFGMTVRVNLFEDISTATALNFILQPQQGEKLERSASDGVVIGSSNIIVDDEQYLADQYLEYTIKENDIDVSGQWRIKGEATLSTSNKVVSDYKFISVLD